MTGHSVEKDALDQMVDRAEMLLGFALDPVQRDYLRAAWRPGWGERDLARAYVTPPGEDQP